MKFKIEKRFSNDIRLEGEAETFKEFIEKNKSDLSDSNLRGSDLRWAKIKVSQKDELLRALKIEIID